MPQARGKEQRRRNEQVPGGKAAHLREESPEVQPADPPAEDDYIRIIEVGSVHHRSPQVSSEHAEVPDAAVSPLQPLVQALQVPAPADQHVPDLPCIPPSPVEPFADNKPAADSRTQGDTEHDAVSFSRAVDSLSQRKAFCVILHHDLLPEPPPEEPGKGEVAQRQVRRVPDHTSRAEGTGCSCRNLMVSPEPLHARDNGGKHLLLRGSGSKGDMERGKDAFSAYQPQVDMASSDICGENHRNCFLNDSMRGTGVGSVR